MAIEVTPYTKPLNIEETTFPIGEGYEINNVLSENSKIEVNIYSFPNEELLYTEYNYKSYSIETDQLQDDDTIEISDISINPEDDFGNLYGAENNSSQYLITYNFYNNIIGSDLQNLFIKEISPDRTEIKIDSIYLDIISLESQTENFVSQRKNSNYFIEFYLNFGSEKFITAVNLKIEDDGSNDPLIYIKLKNPLPNDYYVNDSFWVVTILEEPVSYKISNTPDPIEINDTLSIKGPNFNLDIKGQVNNSTLPLSYLDLITTSQTSSKDQLNNLLNEKSLNINIDYTNFNNFVHFSSAQTRIENFQYKIELIESYSSSLNTLNNTSTSTNMSSSKSSFEGKITNIINNFDGYERFLYYNTGSFSYPKTTPQIPYVLAKSDSTSVINWLGNGNIESPFYGGIYSSASSFDINNRNQLLRSIPEYLRDDSSNQQYELFIDMVAQYYDNIWIYLRDITNKYDNDNRLNFGVSKDLVADAIRDFGIKLYQNNFSNNDLYTAFLGLTPEGGLFPYPNMTGSLPTPSGFEYVDTLISASNDILPQEDVNKSLYKRIYHNLPYLLSSKGTIPGLKALITSYGIPDTILRINEFGGKDKVNVNDWDHWQNEFNYSFNTTGSTYVSSSWGLHISWSAYENTPSTLAFRFKPDPISSGSIPTSQSLWYLTSGPALNLRYAGSGFTSASHEGSIKDPEYQYAYLDFYPNKAIPSQVTSVYLPFFNGDWWSVMAQVVTGQTSFELHAANNIYEGGNNDTRLGFYTSSKISGVDNEPWNISTPTSYFPATSSFRMGTSLYVPFSGSYQEIRYYTRTLSESIFKDYTMNPYSIEGNSINSSPNELAFRAPLGGELYTGSISIHPKVTGSWGATQSFQIGSSSFHYSETPSYYPNTEYFFVDQPVAGIKNTIGDKIRIENNIFPKGFSTSSVLSPYESLLQQTSVSQSYTPNINYLEVAFSPQNQINEDIMSQLGFFNIGEYIGDPRLRSSSAESYPDLDKLRDDYFRKYIKNYNLTDFIRLIKFFDNSLFKMIKDFVPARTSLASGLVIKQHLLERNKYPQPQVTNKTTIAKYAKSGSIHYNQLIQQQNLLVSGTILPQSRDYTTGTIVKVGGGTGGTFEPFNNLTTSPYGISGSGPTNRYFLTQSWNESIYPASSGSIIRNISNQDEFYNGEFSGSLITVTTQSLAIPYPDNIESFSYSVVLYRNGYYNLPLTSYITENQFLNNNTTPSTGEVLLLSPLQYELETYPPGKFNTFFTNPYIKINKVDCNNKYNDVSLGQAKIIKIQDVGSATYRTFNIESITEYSNYYLYKLQIGDLNPLGSGIYSEVKNYFVSSSITSSITFGNGASHIVDPWHKELGNISHYTVPYFSTSSGIFTLGDTPNIPLQMTASFHTDGNGSTSEPFNFVRLRNGNKDIIKTINISVGNIENFSLSASFTPLKSDQYYFELTKPAVGLAVFMRSASLLITQSVNPVAEQCTSLFMEPYITEPNYYNSDYNPTMNNVMENRKNTIYQDVDYSSGINRPVNFKFLISGSAEKFPIPDSHYTQKSSIIPRYLGAKSTSQLLNTWSPPGTVTGYRDVGTFGKLATVDSLKTKIIYADWIGGYPPEHMNASGIHVQYIIDENGSIKIPNTSPNSLEDVQQNFESKNQLIINSNTIGTGDPSPKRNIIRGGYRIEPILYTQFGHSPAKFNVTASFVGDFVSDQTTINDYQAFSAPSASRPIVPYAASGNGSGLDFNNNMQLGAGASSWTNNYYVVSQDLIDENITLSFYVRIAVALAGGALGGQTFKVYFNLIHQRGGVETVIGNNNNISYYTDQNINDTFIGNASMGATLSPNSLQAGDRIFVRGRYFTSTPTIGDIVFSPGTSFIEVSQNPIPTDGNAVSSSGTNTIWGYPDSSLSYAITASNPTLNQFYGKGYKMNNTIGYATGSGFGEVSLPWELEIGDEFRFQGNENSVFMVKKVYNIGETDQFRLSETGSSIEVQFDKNISTSSINLDKFLIRRYVPDSSQIIMEGFKPTNAVGPYIIKPEYITTELNKDIDDYILDLTNKGLI